MSETNQKYGHLVVANWKMYPETGDQARVIYQATKKQLDRLAQTQVVVAPPAVFLPLLSGYARPKNLALGAQDCHYQNAGSFTGEISPVMIKDQGGSWVIVGHSERRAIGESDESVATKVNAALALALRPIICVGEAARDEEGVYLAKLEKQILASVKGVKDQDLSKLVIAYEPIWAIGRKDNQALTGRSVFEMKIFIQRTLARKYGKAKALTVRILYGGSVTPDNTADIMEEGNVNGLLVGRQSLDPAGFREVISLVEQTVR